MSKLVFASKKTLPLNLVENEDGFVLVTALLIMVLLTILGIAATNTAITELQISANDRDYKRNFYRAEGAVMEAAQILENETDKEELLPGMTTKPWLQSIDASDYSSYDDSMKKAVKLMEKAEGASLDDSTSEVRYATFSRGVAKGSKGASLSMSGTTVREYSVYGRSEERAGDVMVEIGYKKRF